MTRQKRVLTPVDPEGIVTWIHFGDLHTTEATEENYLHLKSLVEEANRYFGLGVSFAVLPGDCADDGTEQQYRIIGQAVDQLKLPLYAIPGDHDSKSGNLEFFKKHLESNPLQAFFLGAYRFLFLNSLDTQERKRFDFSPGQITWFSEQLTQAAESGQRCICFMHTYPSELATSANRVNHLVRAYRVLLIEMGHTHYNELANNGTTIYAATRSTGQIEEGPVGLSVTSLDQGTVSWKFKELGAWPFVLITSPCDLTLIVDASSHSQVVRGPVQIRARIWGNGPESSVTVQVNGQSLIPMDAADQPSVWCCDWDSSSVADGAHAIRVIVHDSDGRIAEDAITVLVNQSGRYEAPEYHERDMDNAIGAYPGKGILGTQLGPNKNGRKW